MAKRIYTVESILSVVRTGLTGDDARSFEGFVSAELGAYKAELAKGDSFGGLTLKGKGDKAKGTFSGGEWQFSGGHNAASLCIHFGCLAWKQADTLGILPPTIDMSTICEAWRTRRARKAEAAEAVA